jgi:predicted nucleotidyltransferase
MLQLSEQHHMTIAKILSSYPYRFYVFGSRVKGKARPLSDLDLCIKSDTPIPLKQLAQIDADFEESDLPFKVDVINWNTISQAFRQLIEKDLIPFA